jgi:hypothetical protein
MNKREYLEAQRELRKERKENRDRTWFSFHKGARLGFLIVVYYMWWILKDTQALQSKLFIWAVGAYTTIALYGLLEKFEDDYPEYKKENKK